MTINNCIPDLDLSTYPVTLKFNFVTSIQKSIFEVVYITIYRI